MGLEPLARETLLPLVNFCAHFSLPLWPLTFEREEEGRPTPNLLLIASFIIGSAQARVRGASIGAGHQGAVALGSLDIPLALFLGPRTSPTKTVITMRATRSLSGMVLVLIGCSFVAQIQASVWLPPANCSQPATTLSCREEYDYACLTDTCTMEWDACPTGSVEVRGSRVCFREG